MSLALSISSDAKNVLVACLKRACHDYHKQNGAPHKCVNPVSEACDGGVLDGKA